MRLLKNVSLPPGAKFLSGLGVLLFLPFFIFAQAKTVTGTVKDETGMPVSGASVTVKKQNTGTTTNEAGSFSISASNGNVLVISAVAYEPVEVTVGTETNLSIQLKTKATDLSDVVVVGYASQKKVNLTGSVATINSKDLANRPITNVSSALGGLAPGLSVSQGSGDPRNDGATIRIRGLGTLNNNNPLFLVDGIQVSSIDLVNPNDIESISILKDAASASIYGAQGANGVVMITTKKGTTGKTSVTYTAEFSTVRPMRLLNLVSDYPRYMQLINESARNIGLAEQFTQTTIQNWLNANKEPNTLNSNAVPNYVAFPNTDWFDAIFQKNNLVQNHNVSVSGGNEKSAFLFSMGYLDNPGTMENTGIKRYQLRVNVEAKPAKFLTIGTQNFASIIKKQMGNTSNAFTFLHQTTPGVYPFYNGHFGFPEAPEESATANNILSYLRGTGGKDITSNLSSSVYANLALFKGFSFDSRFNYQTSFSERNTFPVPIERWSLANNTLKAPAGIPANASVNYRSEKKYSYTLEEVLRYNTKIANDHEIGAIVGFTEYYANDYNFDVTKMGLTDWSLYTLNSATTPTSATGNELDRSLQSFFGRINYAYKGKYLVEANLRRDGSSQFSPENRIGSFKSFSAGWRISEEAFFDKWRPHVKNLKLRASWGDLGNNRVDDYVSQPSYGNTGYYSFNGVANTGLIQSFLANSLLKWESTQVTNIGLDATLFQKNNLDVSLELYRKYTYDVIINPPIPPVGGTISSPYINGPQVENKGVELTLGWRQQIRDLKLSIGGNFAYNKNSIVKYRGSLVQGWVKDANGKDVFNTNLGLVASSATSLNPILEGYLMNEYFLLNVYRGSGSHFNSDGSVNKNGGPRDGMIRTQQDLQWLQAMKAAGYKFSPLNSIGNSAAKGQLYYGDLIYADNNSDSTYGNSGDRSFMKSSATPKFFFGFNMGASWKGFDFSMLWAGSFGVKYYWNESVYNRSNTRLGFGISERVADNRYYYNDANPTDPANNVNGKLPRLVLSEGITTNTVGSDFWLYDASYVKLKNLQIGYTIPANIAQRAFVSNARIFVSAENLLMITKFPGLDPEVGAGIGYPTMKQFALGINLSF